MFCIGSFPDGYLKKSHGFGKQSDGHVRLVNLKTLPKSTFVYIFALIFLKVPQEMSLPNFIFYLLKTSVIQKDLDL